MPPVKLYPVGDEMLSAGEIAERCDLDYFTVIWRLRRGWDIEEVMNRPVRVGCVSRKTGKGWHLNGKPVSQKELAALAGVSEPRMSLRLREPGMTPEKAVAIGNPRKPKP